VIVGDIDLAHRKPATCAFAAAFYFCLLHNHCTHKFVLSTLYNRRA
jgi:hypothetical protein